jgi:hypothetical protein
MGSGRGGDGTKVSMTADLSLDVAAAPEATLARIASGLNRRPKRLLGVLKVENEYIGYVHGERFEIWERRQGAVHAVGNVRGRKGGSHIAIRFVVPMRTRVLLVVFFVLYAVVAAGLAIRSGEDAVSAQEAIAALLGAVAVSVIFVTAALRQRADLRGFVERLFSDAPRI